MTFITLAVSFSILNQVPNFFNINNYKLIVINIGLSEGYSNTFFVLSSVIQIGCSFVTGYIWRTKGPVYSIAMAWVS